MFEFYLAQEYWFAAAQLSLAMLGMGATLTVKDFGAIVSTPRAFTVGMVLQLILVPLVAFLFIMLSGAATGVLNHHADYFEPFNFSTYARRFRDARGAHRV